MLFIVTETYWRRIIEPTPNPDVESSHVKVLFLFVAFDRAEVARCVCASWYAHRDLF